MIVFDLKCAPGAHVFEAWFGSSADYEGQKARGLVSCPLCGSDDVSKAPMAPAVPIKGNARPGATPAPVATGGAIAADAEAMKTMLAAAAALQRKLLENSESVGDRFVDEARAIHGRATPADAAALVEEGITVAPLPFPVIEPGQEN